MKCTTPSINSSVSNTFHGDYWIIDLGENYEYAVVGHPTRKYLWILFRTPFMDDAIYDRIVKRL